MSGTPGKSDIKLRRVYEPASAGEGTKILVDRLWPRGVRKDEAAIDHWFKDLAPSATLRQWFGHRLERWPEFRQRYRAELAEKPQALAELRELARHGPVTLLFAARDEQRNNAVVLREVLCANESEAGGKTRTPR